LLLLIWAYLDATIFCTGTVRYP